MSSDSRGEESVNRRASGQPLPPALRAFEAALAGLQPTTDLDHDQVIYELGRAAGRLEGSRDARRTWVVRVGASVAVSVAASWLLFLAILSPMSSEAPVADRPAPGAAVAQDREPEPGGAAGRESTPSLAAAGTAPPVSLTRGRAAEMQRVALLLREEGQREILSFTNRVESDSEPTPRGYLQRRRLLLERGMASGPAM